MLARVRILLPYLLHVATPAVPASVEFERDGVTVLVRWPYQSAADRSIYTIESVAPPSDIADSLGPLDPVRISPNVRIDGGETFAADAIQVELRAPAFARTSEDSHRLAALAVDSAQGALERIRSVTRAAHVRRLTRDETVWRLDYLNEDGSELAPAPPLLRASISPGAIDLTAVAVTNEIWEAARSLPKDFRTPPWETLFLDAVSTRWNIGPALVLMYAALEARITNAIEVLIDSTDADPELWSWITDRDEKFHLQPSMKDKYSVVIKALSGESLKVRDAKLWQSFVQIGKGRNSFAHGEPATIDRKPVTDLDMIRLLDHCGRILNWVDSLLPSEHRRPQREIASQIEVTRFLAR
ncbi:hypothetical protein OM076_43275 [Solirubrobacter ginsenosidimutans]|uniref:Apea-like HEPN domain-containing protein n=1 Tax=Solirubrobacter ginsenosidimutans TaxID=490573 RepID=A0A9X3S8N2_9ACTN|nr:hypothetical protein [Solirubrobacter ginsenosidimutans]MDA0167161.1 hypothetical protein [Solirubrobacter ginsenosidimutans]